MQIDDQGEDYGENMTTIENEIKIKIMVESLNEKSHSNLLESLFVDNFFKCT